MKIGIKLATPDDAGRFAEIHARSWEFAYGLEFGQKCCQTTASPITQSQPTTQLSVF